MKVIKLRESDIKRMVKRVLTEQENKKVTPEQFVNDLKQTLWGRGPSREGELGNKKAGNPQQYTMLMDNENEIKVYFGKYKDTGPDYIVQL